MATDDGRSPSGPGLRPFGAEPQDASQAKPLVPNAVKWLLLYDDNSERLEVSYDLQSHWGSDVRICTNDSSDWEVRIDAQDLRWLAARLVDAASAIEARSDKTAQQGLAEGESAARETGDAQ